MIVISRDWLLYMLYTFMCMCMYPVAGNSSIHGVLVGTNQGGVLGFTLDMPSAKHRETRSPIIMPIGEYKAVCT